jgi:hypothetical protein
MRGSGRAGLAAESAATEGFAALRSKDMWNWIVSFLIAAGAAFAGVWAYFAAFPLA